MSSRVLLAAGLALALGGCTLADRRTDPVILPAEDLVGRDLLAFQVQAAAGGTANVEIDGRDHGTVQTNTPVAVRLTGLTEGEHVLRVTVFDGPYPATRVERRFTVDRMPPVITLVPVDAFTVAPNPFRVQLRFPADVVPGSVASSTTFLDDRARPLPTDLAFDADGQGAVATLLVPLERLPRVSLVYGARDRAGNEGGQDILPTWSAPASPFQVPADLRGGSTMTVPVALDPGWAGPAGPVRVLLCTADPARDLDPFPKCRSQVLDAAPGSVVFDTSALANQSFGITVRAPGLLDSPLRTATVFNALLTVDVVPAATLVNGPVALQIEGAGDIPSSLEVLVGDAVAGTIEPAPGATSLHASIVWDGNLPDGTYPITVRASGTVHQPIVRTVTVDRTPPGVTLSGPAQIDLLLGGTSVLTFTEPVRGTVVRRASGAIVASITHTLPTTTIFLPSVDWSGIPWEDVELTVDASGVRDAAGNSPVAALPLERSPVWLALAGEGPLEAGGTPLVASEAVAGLVSNFASTSGVRIALVDQAGQLRAGPLASLPAAPLNAPGSTAKAIASTGSGRGPLVAWLETAGGTTSLVQAELREDLTLVGPARAVSAGASAPRAAPSGFGALSWTEPDGGGGRAVHFSTLSLVVIPDGSGLPATVLDAIDECCVARGAGTNRLLAWIDGATAVPQLALSASLNDPTGTTPEGAWEPLLRSANADPGLAASDPSLYQRWVAWAEGGQIRAGHLGADGTTFLRDDPSAAAGARWPRLHQQLFIGSAPLLLFVEPGAEGDVIAARLWVEGTGWLRTPPVNAGVPGEVRSLAASAQLVTWTNAAGHVYTRRINRP